MIPTGYDKNLAIKILVLRELREAVSLSGDKLHARVECQCEHAYARTADFDFVHWVGTTFWGVLDTFAESGFLTYSGKKPIDSSEWCTATLCLTPLGERFLGNALDEAGYVLEMLDLSSSAGPPATRRCSTT